MEIGQCVDKRVGEGMPNTRRHLVRRQRRGQVFGSGHKGNALCLTHNAEASAKLGKSSINRRQKLGRSARTRKMLETVEDMGREAQILSKNDAAIRLAIVICILQQTHRPTRTIVRWHTVGKVPHLHDVGPAYGVKTNRDRMDHLRFTRKQ